MASVSMRDVAAHAGVSVGTVSHVINHPDKVAPSTQEKVNSSIAELGFVRNAAASQLKSGRSMSIGMIVLDASNPFFMSVNHGAELACDAAGYSLLLGNSGTNTDRERRFLDLFAQQRVDGVLITPADASFSRLASLRSKDVPIVLVDRESPDHRFPSVAVDNVAGGRLAMEHLLAGGARRPAFVGGPLSLPQVTDRLAGARLAAGEAGAHVQVLETTELTVLAGREAGERLVAMPAHTRPDAVFCANDLLAMGLMQAVVMSEHMRIPEDIRLVGFDDIDFATSMIVPLTSVRQPAEKMGATAVEYLLRRKDRPEERDFASQRFTPELVIRESA